jgi:hypothetical protein
MTVWIYVDASKEIGDKDQLRASRAFQYPLAENASTAAPAPRWEWAEKPRDSMLTISGDIHYRVME